MMRKAQIATPRQFKALQVLLEYASLRVKDMGLLIGALRPRQVIHEPRHQGFHGVILTRRFSAIDRYGEKCRPGEYFIPMALKPWVAVGLNKPCSPESFKNQRSMSWTYSQYQDNGGA